MKPKQLTGIGLAAMILIGMMFIPATEDLTQAGIRTIGMLIAFLVMLITNPFRLFHTGLFFLGLMPVLGVAPTFGAALSGLGNPVILFVIASFGIAAAFTTLPLSKRILAALLRRFGKDIRHILLAIMTSGFLISGFVSSVPTCAVFMVIALNFLELYDDPEEKKRSARAFMIGVPVSIMIGAIMTPIGGAISLIALDRLYAFTGTTIPFIQWMVMGIPVAVVTLPLAWWLIMKIHKPVEVSEEKVEKFIKSLDIPVRITRPEKIVLAVTCIMMALWIISSWVKGINVMVVAILGVCVLCIPQLKTLQFETFVKNIGWDPVFLAAAVFAMGDLMVSNGVSDWIISILPALDVSTPVFIGFTAVLLFTLLLVIPIGPSLIIIMAAPLIALSISAGVSPAIVMLAAAVCCNCSFLLPLDTVALLTYSKGHYSIKDMFISSLPVQIFLVVILALWLTFMSGVFRIG